MSLLFKYGFEGIVCKQIVQLKYTVFELRSKIRRGIAAYPRHYLEHDEQDGKGNGKEERRAEYLVYYFKQDVVYLYNALYDLYNYYPKYLDDDEQNDGEQYPVRMDIGKERAHVAAVLEPVVELIQKIAHGIPIKDKAEYEIAYEYRYNDTEDAAREKFQRAAEAEHQAQKRQHDGYDDDDDVDTHKASLFFHRFSPL